MEPDRELQLCKAFANVPGNIVGSGRTRRDDPRGKGLTDHLPRQADDMGVQRKFALSPGFQPAHHEILSRHDAFFKLHRQHRHQALVQRVGQAVGERPDL